MMPAVGGVALPARFSAPTSHDELRAALVWARALAQASPAHAIGIAVEDLAQRREEVRALAEDVLCPALQLPGNAAAPRPYSISLGTPLADAPLVATALSLLALAHGPIPRTDAAALLRSPYLPGAWGRARGMRAGMARRGPRAGPMGRRALHAGRDGLGSGRPMAHRARAPGPAIPAAMVVALAQPSGALRVAWRLGIGIRRIRRAQRMGGAPGGIRAHRRRQHANAGCCRAADIAQSRAQQYFPAAVRARAHFDHGPARGRRHAVRCTVGGRSLRAALASGTAVQSVPAPRLATRGATFRARAQCGSLPTRAR